MKEERRHHNLESFLYHRLRDLLAVPMQRVLKYHLLLKELLTHTLSVHEEFLSVEKAYEAMVDVSEYINEVKRDSEQMHIISEIQNSISDLPEGLDLREAGGRLRKDAELKVQSHDLNAKTKVRYVFVFDQLMMMCKSSKGDTYGYKDSLKLAEYKIEDIGEMIPCSNATQGNICYFKRGSFLREEGRGGGKRWVGEGG